MYEEWNYSISNSMETDSAVLKLLLMDRQTDR
jgi:hypothetical protein